MKKGKKVIKSQDKTKPDNNFYTRILFEVHQLQEFIVSAQSKIEEMKIQ